MRRISLRLYVTLDGISEFPEYPGSGEAPTDEPDELATEMWTKSWENIDTLLFDRETYEQWAEFWPISQRPPEEHGWYRQMSEFAERAEKVVFSDTLKEPVWRNTRVLSGDLAAAVATLRSESGKEMALVGSTRLAQQFMRLHLLDEYFLAVFPVVLGRGPSLFGALERQETLELLEVKRCRFGELFLHYRSLR